MIEGRTRIGPQDVQTQSTWYSSLLDQHWLPNANAEAVQCCCCERLDERIESSLVADKTIYPGLTIRQRLHSVSILPVEAIKWVICGVRLLLYHHQNGHHLRTHTHTQTKRSQRRKASYLTWWMNTTTKNISNQLLTGMHYKVTKTNSQKSSKKDNYENKR